MRNVAKKGLLTAVAAGGVLASAAGYAYAGADAQGVAAGSPGVASGNSVQVPIEVPINACGNTVDVIGLLNPAYGNHCANVSGHPGGAGSGHAGSGTAGSGNAGSGHAGSGSAGAGQASSGQTASGASASGTAAGSPGVLSGNSVQAPVDIPVNACGNTVDVVGVGNPAFGNGCGNVSAPVAPPHHECSEECVSPSPTPCPGQPCTPTSPPTGETPPPTPRSVTPTPTPPVTPGTRTTPASSPSGSATPVSGVTKGSTPGGGQLAATGAGSTELLGAAGLALLLGGGVLYRRSRAGAR
ncbi:MULTISPECIES: chaplin [unclassified Kitasatospora]|uniref:chaplin n=1 Tax=unclassified Kitasatospora TaxID=2633591 RepID=UPI003803D828